MFGNEIDAADELGMVSPNHLPRSLSFLGDNLRVIGGLFEVR